MTRPVHRDTCTPVRRPAESFLPAARRAPSYFRGAPLRRCRLFPGGDSSAEIPRHSSRSDSELPDGHRADDNLYDANRQASSHPWAVKFEGAQYELS